MNVIPQKQAEPAPLSFIIIFNRVEYDTTGYKFCAVSEAKAEAGSHRGNYLPHLQNTFKICTRFTCTVDLLFALLERKARQMFRIYIHILRSVENGYMIFPPSKLIYNNINFVICQQKIRRNFVLLYLAKKCNRWYIFCIANLTCILSVSKISKCNWHKSTPFALRGFPHLKILCEYGIIIPYSFFQH